MGVGGGAIEWVAVRGRDLGWSLLVLVLPLLVVLAHLVLSLGAVAGGSGLEPAVCTVGKEVLGGCGVPFESAIRDGSFCAVRHSIP